MDQQQWWLCFSVSWNNRLYYHGSNIPVCSLILGAQALSPQLLLLDSIFVWLYRQLPAKSNFCEAIKKGLGTDEASFQLCLFGHLKDGLLLKWLPERPNGGRAKNSGQYFKSQQLLCVPSQAQFATWLLTDERLAWVFDSTKAYSLVHPLAYQALGKYLVPQKPGLSVKQLVIREREFGWKSRVQ